jgi:DNA polymerase-3 subunit epsilon
MGARTRFAACALADIGRCPAPCDGRVDPERYGELVRDLLSSLRSPDGLLGALEARMAALAEAERFEEAGSVRDRLRALAGALHRERQDRWLLGAGRLEVVAEGTRALTFVGGALTRAGDEAVDAIPLPCPRERADELSAVRSWLAHHPVRLVACDAPLAEPVDGGARIARLVRWSRDAEHARSRRR